VCVCVCVHTHIAKIKLLYIHIYHILTTNNVIGPVLLCRLYVQPQQRNISDVDCGSRCCHVMETQSLF